jgi:hypothetical protein
MPELDTHFVTEVGCGVNYAAVTTDMGEVFVFDQ